MNHLQENYMKALERLIPITEEFLGWDSESYPSAISERMEKALKAVNEAKEAYLMGLYG
jgi:hypothetical protein